MKTLEIFLKQLQHRLNGSDYQSCGFNKVQTEFELALERATSFNKTITNFEEYQRLSTIYQKFINVVNSVQKMQEILKSEPSDTRFLLASEFQPRYRPYLRENHDPESRQRLWDVCSSKKEKELHLKNCRKSMDELQQAINELEQEIKLTKNQALIVSVISFVVGIFTVAFMAWMGFFLGSLVGFAGALGGAFLCGLLGSLVGFGAYASLSDFLIKDDELHSSLATYSIFAKQVVNEADKTIRCSEENMVIEEKNYVGHLEEKRYSSKQN